MEYIFDTQKQRKININRYVIRVISSGVELRIAKAERGRGRKRLPWFDAVHRGFARVCVLSKPGC